MNKHKLNISYQVKSNLANYKEIDPNRRTIKAVVNTYNFFDSDYDVLRLGAAKKSIQERGANSKANDKILHALFHDLTRLPGKSINENETVINGNSVLYAESKLSETIEGEETLIKYQDGIYNQHSIGFKYMQIEYVEKGSEFWGAFLKDLINAEDAETAGFGWNVKEIQWFEWSTVPFGSNKLTPFLGTKSQNKSIQLANIYSKLDALICKAKKLEIKDKKIFELQMSQLKQMIAELTTSSDAKSTLTEPQKAEILKQKAVKNFYINLLKN